MMKIEIILSVIHIASVLLMAITSFIFLRRKGILTIKGLPIVLGCIFVPVINTLCFLYLMYLVLKEKFEDMEDFVVWKKKE